MNDQLLDLRNRGVTMLDPIPLARILRVREYFRSRPVYPDAHVPVTAIARGDSPVTWDAAKERECVCATTENAICAPYLFEYGLTTLELAAAYLEHEPRAYSMNAFWTRPTGGIRGDIQSFHRDADDVRFLAIFFYLTDVTIDEDGPHDLTGPDGVTRTMHGPAGTVFASDTRNLHRGRKPTHGERGIAWFRWGVSEKPESYVWDKNEPVTKERFGVRYPRVPRFREAVKLLVA